MTALSLFPYQHTGVAFLAGRTRALLADEMGLGKSPTAVAAADAAGCDRVLVLAPASIVTNWCREFNHWQKQGRRILPVRCASDVPSTAAVAAIVSYDTAKQPAMLNALLARRWDVLIADEAHFLKNRMSARARTVLGPNGDGVGGLLSCCARAWGLTGTPMPNSADELWPLLCAFGPEALESDGKPMAYWSWRRRYCVEIPLGGSNRTKIVGVRHKDELRARVGRVMLRRRKADVLPDLPPIREAELALSAEHYAAGVCAEAGVAGADMDMLRAVSAKALAAEDPDKAAAQALEALSEDSVSRLRRLTAVLKARAVATVLAEELAQTTAKVVVFAWHREAIAHLALALGGFGAVVVDGAATRTARQAAVDAFQGDPATRVFIGQIQAAGTGLTLTAAADLVFVELSWVPAENAQAAMRVHRIGQHQPVLVRYATLADTIDEAVVRTLRRKSRDIATIIEEAA